MLTPAREALLEAPLTPLELARLCYDPSITIEKLALEYTRQARMAAMTRPLRYGMLPRRPQL